MRSRGPSRPDETDQAPREPLPTLPLSAGDEPTESAVAAQLSPFGSGRRIGPYRLLSEVGRGGMGAVYLAARADQEYEKKVAIKVVAGGTDREEVVRRFRRERQILARLDHPNIARLLDGGTTEEGLPYFVMEYIEGQAVPRYCDERRLDVASRLRLFLQVCSAVEYAHRNLIVHRDIKPGNILVTAEGVPRLLDFGIAKLVGPDPEAHEATQTAAMTPAYASPEQVRGEPITTASDVYSLGVLLYELLTGHHPYRLKTRHPLEFMRAVCEQEAERPSTAIDRTLEMPGADGRGVTLTAASVSRVREGTPERLKLRLKGDLDDILMLALRKEPQRRYPSVEAFAADIRRYLEGRPVAARKGTVAYRTGKFVRRHRWAVAGAASLVALLAGWAVSLEVQSVRIARERDKAQQVASFLVELFDVSSPQKARGNEITAREVLDRGAERIRGELHEAPEVRATLLFTLSNVYDKLGLYDPAIDMAREALRLRREVLGSEHPDVAASLNTLGNALSDKGDYAAAEPVYRETLALRRTLHGAESPWVAESLNNLASVLQFRGAYEESETLLLEALAMKRKLYGNEDQYVANSLSNLAVVRYMRGDYSGAETMMREALAIQRKVLGEDHPDVAGTVHNVGVLVAERGEWAEAEAAYRDALARQRKLFGAEHADVATTLVNLGNALVQRGDFAAARPLFEESLAIQRKLLGPDSADTAANLEGLAAVRAAGGDLAGSAALWSEALAVRRKHLGPSHPDTAQSLAGLARVEAARGRLAAAEALARESLEIRRSALAPAHPELAESLLAVARVLIRAKRFGEAEAMARQAREILSQLSVDARWRAAEADAVLGACLAASGRGAEAEARLLEAYESLRAKVGEKGSRAREAREALASLYEASGRPADAARFR